MENDIDFEEISVTKEQLEKEEHDRQAKKKLKNIPDIPPILLCKDLFDIITRRELDKFIVGELESRQTIFLCAMGYLVENSQIASYNLLVNDVAGIGKDYVVGATLKILPKSKLVKRTRISPTVFTYWHNAKYEPEWTWDGKALYLEDISENVFNSPVFKVMCSSGSSATIVKDQRAIDIEIKGKPVVITTSASTIPNPELARRFTILNMDSGVDQTKEIMRRHAKMAATGKTVEYDEDIRDALCALHRVKVSIPFAEKLVHFLPHQNVVMRTHFSRFLDYIKASAALHQYQRKKNKDGYLISVGQDYDTARIIVSKTTTNQFMLPLTKDQKSILTVLEALPNQEWFAVSDLLPKISFIETHKTMKSNLDKLVAFNLLDRDSQRRGDNLKETTVYQYIENPKIKLPTWEELQDAD